MRQGQQNRRGRGRNRKGQNPLTRSFESTGPDVKIRGTPAHIAEKYMSLARDATSSGDPVLAENYLQHAEHYNSIIMAWLSYTSDAADELTRVDLCCLLYTSEPPSLHLCRNLCISRIFLTRVLALLLT